PVHLLRCCHQLWDEGKYFDHWAVRVPMVNSFEHSSFFRVRQVVSDDHQLTVSGAQVPLHVGQRSSVDYTVPGGNQGARASLNVLQTYANVYDAGHDGRLS